MSEAGSSRAPAPPPPASPTVEAQLPVDWRRVHLLQIQPIRDAAVILLILGLFKLGYLLSAVTVPLLIAVLLAYLFEPVVKKLTKRGKMRRPVAVGAIIAAIVLGIGGPVLLGLTFSAIQAVTYAQKMGGNIEALRASIANPNDAGLARRLPGSWRTIRDLIVDVSAIDSSAATGGVNPPAPPNPSGATANPGSTAPPGPAAPAGPSAPTTSSTPAASTPPPGAVTPPGPDVQADPAAAPTGATTPPSTGPDAAAVPRPADAQPGKAPASTTVRGTIDNALEWAQNYFKQNAASIGKVLGKEALGTGTGAVQAMLHFVVRIGFILFSTFLTLFFFFFVSTGWPRVTSSLTELIPDWRRNRVLDLLAKMDRVIAAFVRGRLTIMAILVAQYVLAYWFIGVPAPLLVGVIVGILTLAPYMSSIGVPLCMLLMWLQPVGPLWQQSPGWILLAPLGTYFLMQATDDYFWTPRIQGKATDMDMPTILFAVLAGGILAGFYGVLVAIPVGACLKILVREVAYPRIKAWAAGKVRDPLPISRYSPIEAKQEGSPPPTASAS